MWFFCGIIRRGCWLTFPPRLPYVQETIFTRSAGGKRLTKRQVEFGVVFLRDRPPWLLADIPAATSVRTRNHLYQVSGGKTPHQTLTVRRHGRCVIFCSKCATPKVWPTQTLMGGPPIGISLPRTSLKFMCQKKKKNGSSWFKKVEKYKLIRQRQPFLPVLTPKCLLDTTLPLFKPAMCVLV